MSACKDVELALSTLNGQSRLKRFEGKYLSEAVV